MMRKVLLFFGILVLLIGALNIYGVNEKVDEKIYDAANSASHPGDQNYVSTMQTAEFVSTYWYLIVALILIFIAWVV